MEPEKSDVEIFERIPWEALESRSDRRWMAYVAAAVIVLGAVGVSIGRTSGSQPAVSTPPPDATVVEAAAPADAAVATVATIPEPPLPPPTTAAVLAEPTTEADLMALTVGTVEATAMRAAEWFVVGFFTRDGTDGTASGRSFVDWAGSTAIEWVTPTRADVTVLTRRLAALGADAYQRLPDEGWRVTIELGDEGWVVTDGPVEAEVFGVAVDIPDLASDPPPGLGRSTGDAEVVAASPVEGGWLAEVEWTDAAGLTWPIRRHLVETQP